jgi:hypothetical protein
MDQIQTPQVALEVQAAFAPIMKALGAARAKLAEVENVVTIRPGYKYPEGAAPVPAIVVAVIPGTAPAQADALEKQFGVPFTVIDASVEEQMAVTGQTISFGVPSGSMASAFERMLGGEEELEFAPPKTGSYEEPEASRLQLVNEAMDLTLCVSPEAGWGELEDFLDKTIDRLTVAMYQFTAPHIFEAVEKAVQPAGRTLELILHPVPEKPAKTGVKANDLDEEEDVIPTLEMQMKNRFEQTWATLVSKANPDGLFASAYHIKVAVRDGGAIWLSSGNWQSSNQPDVHPFAPNPKLPPQFQRKYNRDYHAIIVNKKLGDTYEFYIKRDFEESAKQAGEPVSFMAPDLFVPAEDEEAEEPVAFAAPPRFFEPLRLNRKVSVQPLLTPDNYAAETLKLIQSAKESVWFQNQYINFRGTSDDFPEFRALVGALLDKVKKKARRPHHLSRHDEAGKPRRADRARLPEKRLSLPAGLSQQDHHRGPQDRDLRQPQLVERGREDQPRRQPDLRRRGDHRLPRERLRL